MACSYPETRRRFRCAMLQIAALLALTNPSIADEDSNPPPASLALEEVMVNLASSRGLRAHFKEEKHLSILVDPLKSEGVILFSPPDRFARYVQNPIPSALIVDGETLLLRTPAGVDHVNLGSSEVVRAFVDAFVVLFKGDLDEMETHYDVDFHATKTFWRINLAPKKKLMKRIIRSISLRGNHASIEEMEVVEAQGDRSITRFDDVESNQPFSDAEIEALFEIHEPRPIE